MTLAILSSFKCSLLISAHNNFDTFLYSKKLLHKYRGHNTIPSPLIIKAFITCSEVIFSRLLTPILIFG